MGSIEIDLICGGLADYSDLDSHVFSSGFLRNRLLAVLYGEGDLFAIGLPDEAEAE
ncbi:hypothetical protein [Rhodopirellula sp. MGV]|uniref:hypothetical protein n=1 Tax=Rhodopirellula sp. MGV TaxID=2023130 RepID=UPI0013044AE8|nr:hypothetical protein [Rhodopirellula sp. MGV]